MIKADIYKCIPSNRLMLLFLFILFCIVTASCNGISDDSQDKSVMKSVTLNDLKELPTTKPPIVSAEDAINYAVNIESVRSSLEDVALKADFVTWNVNSQLITKDNSNWWEVKIKSSGMLPSFTCTVLVNRVGELLAENYCEYNK